LTKIQFLYNNVIIKGQDREQVAPMPFLQRAGGWWKPVGKRARRLKPSQGISLWVNTSRELRA